MIFKSLLDLQLKSVPFVEDTLYYAIESVASSAPDIGEPPP
jgi:hypothetical protein